MGSDTLGGDSSKNHAFNNTTTNNNLKKVRYLRLPEKLTEALSQRGSRNKSAFRSHTRSNIHVVDCDDSMSGMTSINRNDSGHRRNSTLFRGTIRSNLHNQTVD